MGQTRPTRVVSLVVKGSVEEAFHAIMQRKKQRLEGHSAGEAGSEANPDDDVVDRTERFPVGDLNGIFGLNLKGKQAWQA